MSTYVNVHMRPGYKTEASGRDNTPGGGSVYLTIATPDAKVCYHFGSREQLRQWYLAIGTVVASLDDDAPSDDDTVSLSRDAMYAEIVRRGKAAEQQTPAGGVDLTEQPSAFVAGMVDASRNAEAARKARP